MKQDDLLQLYIDAEQALEDAVRFFKIDHLQGAASASRRASGLFTDIHRAEGNPEEIRKRLQEQKNG